jgi:hypothetical protein
MKFTLHGWALGIVSIEQYLQMHYNDTLTPITWRFLSSHKIKKIILGECREHGINANNFSGVKKWWKSCEPTDEEAELMYEILYGWFEENKKWLFRLEEAVMTLENWQYTKESVLQAEANKRTQGKSLKGCVAQLIAYVKVDLVKHGMNITNSRPKEEMLKMESGKYVRRKKRQIF